MDGIVDLAESRKARSEKSEQLREAATSLLVLLERHRAHISEEFMAFLLAMAISDQALHYAQQGHGKQAGDQFLDNLFNTARQLFDAHYPPVAEMENKSRHEESSGRVLQFVGDSGTERSAD